MAAFGIPRDRSTVVQYLLLVAIMVGGGGTSLALLLDTYRSKVERIYYNGKTFSPYKLVTLNPLLDVKNFLLSRYPLPRWTPPSC